MIRIQNIYYMLSYAFQVLNQEGYKEVATEEFENVAELCAAILMKGVSSQIKRGLGREYRIRQETLSALRGKVHLSASVKERSIIQRKLVCEYDEFSVNSYMNQIVKTTMEILLKSDIKRERKKQICKCLPFFADVDTLRPETIRWNLQYHRHNETYEMLIAVCYFILKGLLQTTSDGKTKLMDFLDEERMCKLYEKFILEYYRKENPELHVSASQIPWNVDDGYREMLPLMQSDVMLEKDGRTLVIDAKYYAKTMQRYYDTHRIHSGNLYQIYTYVKNLDKESTSHISGMLLYAKTDEVIYPNHEYRMGGNKIAVRALDLDCDFAETKEQLQTIVQEFFGRQ